MKIGFISTYFHPFYGGAENNCYYLAKELAKNHEVHVFTSNRKDDKIINKKYEVIENIKIHRFKTIFRYRYYFVFYPDMLKALLKEDFDIIHVHSLGFLWHDICILLKKIKDPETKFVITPHGPFMALKFYPLWQKILKFFVNLVEFQINKIYSLVIQVNPYQYKWLSKDYGFKKDKIVYVPNGISKDLLKRNNSINVNKKYNLKNKFVISYLGRIHEYKGIDQVIKVLPNLLKLNKDIILVVMGSDAGYYNSINQLVKNYNLENNVRIILDPSDEEKLSILELSEIYVFPSEWEAFGITILEAMAKRNVIISTRTEGGKFLVSEDNGLLYDFNNLKQLETCFIRLIKDNKLRTKLQFNNFIKVKEFRYDNISLKLEEEYLKLLK